MTPDTRRFGIDLARACAGPLIFSLPMLMTMEMWWLGFYMSRFRLALFLLLVIPLLVLTLGGVSLALLPVANALSRAHERRADRYALTMTRNVPAFVSAMKRLSAQNLAEEQPSKLVEVLFHSHPPIRARIAAAHAWALQNE